MLLNFCILFGTVAILSLVSSKLKIPLMIGYIITGLLLSNTGLNILTEGNIQAIKEIYEVGLIFVLFIVGLKLDITAIKNMGSAFIVGLLKNIAIIVVGFFFARVLHFDPVPSIFIGLGLSFCSTIVVVKLLSDKGELESYPGRIALGTLIVEDIMAVIAIIVINIVSGGETTSIIKVLATLGWHILLLAGIIFIFGKLIIPKFLKYWAKDTELLLIISLCFAIAFALLCEQFGFSQEVGAFVAGMMFAPYKEFRNMIASKLSPLRDFCIIYIFIYFGILVEYENLSSIWRPILALTLFSVIMKPLICYILLVLFKYKQHTSLKTGLILSQLSEFSLIIISIGIDKKLIQNDVLSILGVSFIFSVLLSSFLIGYAEPIASLLTTKFKFIDNKLVKDDNIEKATTIPKANYQNIIFGYDAFGSSLYDYLVDRSEEVVAIDFDPIRVAEFRKNNINIVYGDINDIDFLSTLNFRQVKWLINTIPNSNHKKTLSYLQKNGFDGIYAVKTDPESDSKEELEKIGVNLIFEPYINAAKEAYFMILHQEEKVKLEKNKKQIANIKNHYIVCGYGKLGRQIAIDLTKEEIPFVIIDDNPENKEELIESGYNYLFGNAVNEDLLRQGQIENAKGIISVYPSDESNVFVIISAKTLNNNLDIISGSINSKNEEILKKAGANKVLSPYVFCGRKIVSAVTRPTVFEFNEKFSYSNEYDMTFEELKLKDDCSFIGKSLLDSNFRQHYGATIVAIKNQDGKLTSNPKLETVFQKGDIIVVMATSEQLEILKQKPEFIYIDGKN